MLLTPDYFVSKKTPRLARFLLGQLLVRRLSNEKIIKAVITETEAYQGVEDEACHARHGRTSRNWPMFGPPGHWYIYFVYGYHQMLNVVTGPSEYPAAVLIRAARLLDGTLLSGPGKLTKFLDIKRNLSGLISAKTTGLWLEAGENQIKPSQIISSPRVGISYAPPEWRDKPWRFRLNLQK